MSDTVEWLVLLAVSCFPLFHFVCVPLWRDARWRAKRARRARIEV